MVGRKTNKLFALGDIIYNTCCSLGEMLVMSIGDDYLQVRYITDKFDGSSFKIYCLGDYKKIGNIFQRTQKNEIHKL